MTIDGFKLIVGFIANLQVTSNSNISWIYAVHVSLHQALNLLSQLCPHHSSGNGFQRQTVSFLLVPELSRVLSTNQLKKKPSLSD
jgi:hypothetical protein